MLEILTPEMEELKQYIGNLISKFDNTSFKETLNEANEYIRQSKSEQYAANNSLADSISQGVRITKQLESEIERLRILQSKNANTFSKRNNERIKLARSIIDLEQENEDMESKVRYIESEILRLEDEIKAMNYPSSEELYFEVIKGFGVEFIEKEKKIYARIKNKAKNDVFMVEYNCDNLNEVCDQIWANME